jgi:hypothetical protein
MQLNVIDSGRSAGLSVPLDVLRISSCHAGILTTAGQRQSAPCSAMGLLIMRRLRLSTSCHSSCEASFFELICGFITSAATVERQYATSTKMRLNEAI